MLRVREGRTARNRGSTVFGQSVIVGGGGNDSWDGLIFSSVLQNTLVPVTAFGDSTPTFTRATTAYVTDFEGLLKPVLSGEARFTGARRVQNSVVKSEDLTVATGGWSVGTATITSGISDPIGGTSAYTITANGANSNWYRNLGANDGNFAVESIWLRRRTGTGTVYLYVCTTATDKAVTLTSSWQRFSASRTTSGGNNYVGVHIVTSGDEVDIWRPQYEYAIGQSNQNPSEYVSVGALSAPYHGANVDGVKYFTTLNGNTVSSNVVTEATGAPITNANSSYADAGGPYGYLAEGARTNRCLYSQDFSNAAWVSGGGGIAVTANSIAAPDGTTTADTLTASGANGTLIQDLGVVASASKTGGLWLKRKTGTGNIDITMDGGTGWTTVAVTTTWTRFSKNQTLADEDFGIRIVTSGDEVYAWQGQVETAAFLSSDIPTTSAAVTRNADVLTYTSTGNVSFSAGAAYAETFAENIVNGGVTVGFAATTYPLGQNSLGRTSAYDGTNNVTATAGTFSTTAINKKAASWGGSTMSTVLNGAAVTSGSFDGAMAGATINIGDNAINPFANIRNVNIYNRPQSDAYWTARTTP